MNSRTSRFVQVLCLALALCVAPARAKTLYWTGSQSENWNHTELNFVDEDGTASAFADLDDVVFDDVHAKVKTVVVQLDAAGTTDEGRPSPATILVDTADTFILTNRVSDGKIGKDLRTITKRGAGKLVLTDCTSKLSTLLTQFSEGIYVEAGEVLVQKRGLLRSVPKAKLRIAAGATLKIAHVPQQDGAGDPAFMRDSGLDVEVASGGKFIVEEPEEKKVIHFRRLVLGDSAAFDYSNLMGEASSGYISYGLFTVSSNVVLGGVGSPHEWLAERARDPNRTQLVLNDSPTVDFEVADVTASADVDFRLDFELRDFLADTTTKDQLPAGFKKSGLGTMMIENRYSRFSGDIDVAAGMLVVGPQKGQQYLPDANGRTFLGLMTNENRKIFVRSGATLAMPNCEFLGEIREITNQHVRGEVVVDGGTIDLMQGQWALLPNLTFRNGGTISTAVNNRIPAEGRVMFHETLKVEGTQPFTWAFNTSETTKSGQSIDLNGYPQNVFDISDVTGDAVVDADFEIPFIVSQNFLAARRLDEWKFGFRKTGAGTMRYGGEKISFKNSNVGGYAYISYNGDTEVAEGTLQVDGDISLSDTVRVSAGAYLAGSGTINHAVFSKDAGLRVSATQPTTLHAIGTVDFADVPVIEIDSNGDLARFNQEILKVDGSITGLENLEKAAVMVNGVRDTRGCVTCDGSSVRVSIKNGLVIFLR